MREKVFNREERYALLCEVFNHLAVDDYVSINNIFEQYSKQNMGFVINQDQELYFEDGEERKESMYGWSLLEVALSKKANKTAINLLKNKNICIMPRADLTDPDLQDDFSPHVVDDIHNLLELEIRPLRTCIIVKDYKMM